MDIGVEQDTKFVRRLGARTTADNGENKRDPRPILVGLVHRYHSKIILENSWKLSEVDDRALSAVSIVKQDKGQGRRRCTRRQPGRTSPGARRTSRPIWPTN